MATTMRSQTETWYEYFTLTRPHVVALNGIRHECCMIGDCVDLLAAERVFDGYACRCAERREKMSQ
jgi:hypothetical protein